MFSEFHKGTWKTIGLRLTFWYSNIFILSSLVFLVLQYLLLSSSIRQYEREETQMELNECAIQYEIGGMDALQEQIDFEKHVHGEDSFLVRFAGPKNNTIFLDIPDQWAGIDLNQLESGDFNGKRHWIHIRTKDSDHTMEIASLRLSDGALLQLGRSTKNREELMERLYKTSIFIVVPVILLGFAGGVFLVSRTLRPIRGLIDTLQSTIETGTFDARVQTTQTNDELGRLVALFNVMLERTEVLIDGMRSSLDNVAHDLRTPLTRLRGNAEIALQSDQSTDILRDGLIHSIEESERILTMLNTLMDISEAETGAMKLDLERVNALALIEDVVELYGYVAEEKAISVHTTCSKKLHLTADSNRIRQVLANLLDNAIKYSPTGRRIDIEACQEQQEVVITVKDSGTGIPPEELSRIWDRLYRGDKSRSEQGLGLGLSLVKAIIHAHGGYVDVSSELGAGALFAIYLPNGF